MHNKDDKKEHLFKEVEKLRHKNAELIRSETVNKQLIKTLEEENKALEKEIKEQKQMDNELRQSEALYKTLVEISSDFVSAYNLKGDFIYNSPQTVKQLRLDKTDELIGKNIFSLSPPEQLPKARDAFNRVLKGETVRNTEFVYYAKDGTRLFGEYNIALVKDSNGKPVCIVSTSKDITKRKLAEQRLQQEVEDLRKQIKQSMHYPKILGNSPKILNIIDLIHQIARTNSTILIFGETGTGKDLIAQAIHHNSPRKESPFLHINCAALPEQLIESELFGYVKGTFTGANQDKKGLFEEADKGTIFLNEIGEMPLNIQAKLLQVLENQQIRRLGQNKNIRVDVRVIAATNKDLKEAVEKGSFRQDLFYRLNVLPVVLPPLRERKEDIPLLARYFLDKHGPSLNKLITEISQEAVDVLCQYRYPGNVRELENIIQRSLVTAQGTILSAEHLPQELNNSRVVSANDNLALMEKQLIEAVIKQCNGNLRKAAEQLAIHRTTLWRKMKRLGIDHHK
jgi:PAS domain S-box-containing protein